MEFSEQAYKRLWDRYTVACDELEHAKMQLEQAREEIAKLQKDLTSAETICKILGAHVEPSFVKDMETVFKAMSHKG